MSKHVGRVTLLLLALGYILAAVWLMWHLSWEPEPLPEIEGFVYPVLVGQLPAYVDFNKGQLPSLLT